MNRIFLSILIVHGAIFCVAQKSITNEAIWRYGQFTAQYVPGFNFLKDGQQYSKQNGTLIQAFDLTTGQSTNTLLDASTITKAGFPGYFNNYTFSEDERKILLETNRESIYRRSSKANFFVYDQKDNSIEPLFDQGKQMYATFNPAGDKVAFVYDNNLYLKNLNDGQTTQITSDGQMNAIINGALDWVYEEEFGFAQGFAWSPDGNSIAFYRFDESQVKEFTLTLYHNDLYPEYNTFKYPKVGETNSTVSVHIYNVNTGKTLAAELGSETDQYIPRIKWTQDPNQLCVYRLNRHQNHIDLLLVDAQTGNSKILLTEKNKYYIEEGVFDNLTFLEDQKHFVWSSEKNGWHHLYLYDLSGKEVKQLTSGEWDITNVYGVDQANQQIYFQAAKNSPLDREIYSVATDGSKFTTIAGKAGNNSAQFSSTYDYYILTHSSIEKPATYIVYDRSGKEIRKIEENQRLQTTLNEHGFTKPEFFNFETSEGIDLNGMMIKPVGFQENQSYPVLMFVYGGPGSQTVTNSWGGTRMAWFQLLAQNGFIVVSVDNRGTGARGEYFKKMTYQQLGKYETVDQIEAAKYLGGLPYVDANRIGIFGWSYGGYMSSLCVLKGNDVFKSAIAVAPVTNWKWYDTIYTERFMRTEKENKEGYTNNSPINFVDQLKGDYLLIHGVGDDNVHFQHTTEMANALISANKQFETYFYPNRNHGIYGDNARLHLYTKMTNFLNRTLK